MKRHSIAIALILVAAAMIGCGSATIADESDSTAESAKTPGRESVTPGQQPAGSGSTGAGAAVNQGSATGQSVSPTSTVDNTASTNIQDPAPAPSPTPANTTDTIENAGEESSEFSLLSTNGGVVNFDDIRGTVPVGLFFYGGADCVACEDRLRTMQEHYSRFKQIGAELIAISTDLPEKTRMTVDSIGVEFPVLSDVNGSVSESWGIFNLSGNGHAAPALFVFGPSGDELGRQIGFSASDLPGLEEMLQTIQRSLDTGTAEPTPTPAPATPQAATPTPEDPIIATLSLGPGVTDFRLPDAIGGGEVSLSETLGDSNVVLVFYRAFW